MNKSLHLTLFLGGICLASTLALATVNAITAPIISQREEDTRNAGYLALLDLSSTTGYTLETITDLPVELTEVGTEKVTVFLDSETSALFGIIYDVSTTGWEPNLNFQVAFKNGAYAGFNNVSNGETPSIGRKLLERLDDILTGLNANDIALVQDAITASFIADSASPTFAGTTRSAVVASLTAIAADYLERVNG